MSRRFRILFDAPGLSERPSGTKSRALGLLPAIHRRDAFDVALRCRNIFSEPERLALNGIKVLPTPSGPSTTVSRMWSQDRELAQIRRVFPFDLLIGECMPFPRQEALILTIHDLRHLRGGSVRRCLARKFLARGLRRARQVHVVSEAIAAELRTAFPEVDSKVIVVPNGVPSQPAVPSASEIEEVLRRRELQCGYLLVVGHLEARKNWRVAIEVSKRLRDAGRAVDLVIVGRGEDRPEEHSGAADLNLRVLRDVEDAELSRLYCGAGLVLAPSRLEGFGIVPLEALSAGVPVLASDIPAHREVLGDRSFLVPPDDVSGFVTRARELLDRPPDLSTLRASRLATYSWEIAASRFEDAIKRLR